MQTVIYIADTAPLQDERVFAALYRVLPVYRRQKIDRYTVADGKRLSLGVGVLLKLACRDQGIPGADNNIIFGEQGKGYFQKDPDVFFNLSHSGERAMCVLSPVETGCDVQQIQKIRWPVARRVFSTEEQNWLRKQELCGRGDEAFTRLWALKESYLKAVGKGFSAAPEGISLSVFNEIVTVENQEEPQNYTFFEPNLEDDYRYACCLKNAPPGTEISVRQCDLTLPQFL